MRDGPHIYRHQILGRRMIIMDNPESDIGVPHFRQTMTNPNRRICRTYYLNNYKTVRRLCLCVLYSQGYTLTALTSSPPRYWQNCKGILTDPHIFGGFQTMVFSVDIPTNQSFLVIVIPSYQVDGEAPSADRFLILRLLPPRVGLSWVVWISGGGFTVKGIFMKPGGFTVTIHEFHLIIPQYIHPFLLWELMNWCSRFQHFWVLEFKPKEQAQSIGNPQKDAGSKRSFRKSPQLPVIKRGWSIKTGNSLGIFGYPMLSSHLLSITKPYNPIYNPMLPVVRITTYSKAVASYRGEIIGTPWDFQLIRSLRRDTTYRTWWQTWWQLRALSPEWRQLLDVRGPGWPRGPGLGPHWLSPLDRCLGSLLEKWFCGDFLQMLTYFIYFYITSLAQASGKWMNMADLNRSVLNRCFMRWTEALEGRVAKWKKWPVAHSVVARRIRSQPR